MDQDKFSKAIHIFPTNDAVNKKNEECLRQLNKPVLNIRATDVPSCVGNIDDDTGLTNNTWVDGGLANGCLGNVCAVIYNENKTSSESPDYIMVQCDNYNGACIDGNLFHVAMIIRICEKNGRRFTRK